MFKNKWLLIILSNAIIYSCQAPHASEQDTELKKLKYSKKIIEVSAKEINRTVFNNEVLSNGILTPVKKAKLVFNINKNRTSVNVKNYLFKGKK